MEGEPFVKKKLSILHIPNDISIGYYAQKNSVSWEYFIHAHIPGAYWGKVPNRGKHHHVNPQPSKTFVNRILSRFRFRSASDLIKIPTDPLPHSPVYYGF